MNIDDLTLREIKSLQTLFSGPLDKHGAIGKKCIVRTYASGVFFGTVVSVQSNEGRSRCELANARRLWKWYGGLSLSEIANNGISQDKSRISEITEQHYIEDVLEFIPASEKSAASIEGAKADDSGK